MQLNLSNIEYTYPSAADPALRGVTATLPQGWIGLVGDNGGGKTMLALVVCGILQPDTGTITPKLLSAYCVQDAKEPPSNVADFALAYDGLAARLRHGLAIEDDWPWRYGTLSGGQQKRLQVACALWAAPDVLAVDEPTNHIDASTRRAIFEVLSRFEGIGFLVSHDRELLDALCAQCLFVADGTAVMRPGGYSQASSQAALERTSAIHARDAARKEKTRIEREAQRRREEASRAAGKRSLRGIGKHDADARRKVRIAVVIGKDGKAGRREGGKAGRREGGQALASYERQAGRCRGEACGNTGGEALRRRRVDWCRAPSRRKLLFRTGPCSLPLGDAFLNVPALHIGNTDHVGLVGDNGSGKTTLVRRIVGSLSDTIRLLVEVQ